MRLIDADALIAEGYVLEKYGESNAFISRKSIADVPTAYDVEKVETEVSKVLQDLNVVEVMSHIEIDKTIQKTLEDFLGSFKTEITRIIRNGRE